MRISRIRIDSFGALRNRDYPVDEGLTVFHGPNESGKTSTMEFIRSLLSPTNARKLYPARRRSDEGSMDITDGDERVHLTYEGKKTPKKAPECIQSMDPVIFREVFAMDLEALNSSDVLTKGEIKRRFLTVPGGERLPAAVDWADSSVKKLVGLRSNSDSQLLNIEESIEQAEANVASMKQRADEYRALSDQVSDLKDERSRLQRSGEEDQRARSVYENYQRNKGNYEHLQSLRAERLALGEFREVTDEDISERSKLVAEERAAKQNAETTESDYKRAKDALGGAGPAKVSAASARIEKVVSGLGQYHSDGTRIEESRPAPAQRPSQAQAVRKKGDRRMVAVGIALAVLGVVLGLAAFPGCFVITAAGFAIAAFGAVRRGGVESPNPVPAPAEQPTDIRVCMERRQDYESEVRGLCKDLGIWFNGIESAVGELEAINQAAAEVRRRETPMMKARNEHYTAANALLRFYQPFSGSEGFDEARTKTVRAKEIDGGIATLENAIRNSGLDPNDPRCPVEWRGQDGGERLSDIDTRIGQLEERMRAILDMTDLELEMDRLEGLRARKASILHKGAVALLAKSLLDASCSDAYESVQPGVVSSADRYLGMMTCGRYTLSIDPSSNDIEIVCGDDRKGMAVWSSGLRAQVLLSIKLAVAKEMGGGEVPMILDDVLLPFDSERKGGAVRALKEISGEMQILLFTCDDEARRLAEEAGVRTVAMV